MIDADHGRTSRSRYSRATSRCWSSSGRSGAGRAGWLGPVLAADRGRARADDRQARQRRATPRSSARYGVMGRADDAAVRERGAGQAGRGRQAEAPARGRSSPAWFVQAPEAYLVEDCRRGPLACSAWPSLRGSPRRVPLLRVRLDHEVGGPLRRVPGLGHASRGRRRHRAHRPRPARSSAPAAPDRRGRRPAAPRPPDRRRRVRPGARRRPRPGRGGAGRRRARHRQVHPAARRRGRARARAEPASAACSTSPARSPPRRCGCAPSASRRWRRTLYLAAETDLATVLGQIDARRARAGRRRLGADDRIRRGRGRGRRRHQVREVAASLIRVAKERGIATVLVGHVTKDGSIAGPRVLEHLVDVVVQFEGDRHSRLRLVRAVKNRYGPTDEVGCFDLSDERHRRARRPQRAVPVPAQPTACPAPA